MNFVQIISNYYGACGITGGGQAFCWGSDDSALYSNVPLAVSQQQQGEISSDWDPEWKNLIALWHFNNNSLESSSVNQLYSGTAMGGRPYFESGKLHDGAAFNSQNSQYMSFANLPLTGDFTISAWVSLSRSGGATNADVILGNARSGNDINFAGAHLRFWTGAIDAVIAKTAAKSDVWTHYVITRAGSVLTRMPTDANASRAFTGRAPNQFYGKSGKPPWVGHRLCKIS